MLSDSQPDRPVLQRPLSAWIPLNLETLLATLILLLAILSRFYGLGDRAMSHDEINHVVPSYDYSQGRTYVYDPVTHGPLQFHLIALSYFLIGDSDFTSRIPAAAFSVASVAAALILYRRYLGRKGALIAGLLLVISPSILFYGRYARNEAFIVLWGLLGLYAILRYLESGSRASIFLLTAVTALHFSDKATSYIFAGEQLIFLAFYLFGRLLARPWLAPALRSAFILALGGAALLAVASLGLSFQQGQRLYLFGLLPCVVLLFLALAFLARGLSWTALCAERSFHLLALLGGLALPLLGSIPLKLAGINPLDAGRMGPLPALEALLPLAALGCGLVYLAAGRDWWKHLLLFWTVFTPLYTSLFANLPGFAGGLFGALGYWMDQQAVNRGSQPWYYYAFLLVPVYEYLPALGALGALIVAWRKKLWQVAPGRPFQPAAGEAHPVPAPLLFLYWSASSLAAFSLAGEKMPWLTVNIALPLILAGAWGLGWLLETRPFLPWKRILRGAALACAAALALLTARAAYRAAFINAELPLEYLVYAHAAPDPKRMLAEIEDLSWKTTGGLNLVVAYDNNVRYPYWWYLRHYPKRIDYDVNPSGDLRKAAVILVGQSNYSKIDPIVATEYVRMDENRLWWPNQDYWRLEWNAIAAERKDPAAPMSTGEYLSGVWRHIAPFLTDPQFRSAVWQIWLNRDYSLYAAYQPHPADYRLPSWQPADRMRIYIRKDLLAKVYGFSPFGSPDASAPDPYQAKITPLNPDLTFDALPLQAPRGLALAPDGSLYLADSRSARILHVSGDGKIVLQRWGAFADLSKGPAPGGTFNEPWGVAVGPDGSVYVADTWNHRIQKFASAGKFLAMWGSFGSTGAPDSLWGPRGLAVDSTGRLYVTDTGNKRVLVFGADGAFVTQFGGPDQLDEPVGIAVDGAGLVYVADTWNRRVQVFQPDPSGNRFQPLRSWPIAGWSSDSLENKPYLALAPGGIVLVTDPETCRVLAFSSAGQFLRGWSSCAPGGGIFSGIALGPDGEIWVSDAAQNRLLRFKSAL